MDNPANTRPKCNPIDSRRNFIKTTIRSAGILPFFSQTIQFQDLLSSEETENKRAAIALDVEKSLIGNNGQWFSAQLKNPPSLSFRNAKFKNLPVWKKESRAHANALLSGPSLGAKPVVKVDKKYIYDGLEIEELSWQLPYGRPTKAVFMKPVGANKPLPAILGLHDHAGKKYFGFEKLVKTADEQHPLIVKHQAAVYSGRPWANDIAKRGYAVLVHDTYAFGSRRVHYSDVKGFDYGPLNTQGKTDDEPEKEENILAYNEWSKEHEHVMAKSLFCAGTTWPGVSLAEDQVALSILSDLPDVDAGRIGCAGLSGGGVRTVYLAGMDDRIKCAVCVGFMTTWNDLIVNKSFNHTWMTFAPLLPNFLDFPEIVGLRVPLATLVLNNNQDALFTLEEMKKADTILKEVYQKAGAADKYHAGFYEGPHKFDQQMQTDAFDWFDKWLSVSTKADGDK
jgi:dienelactone hydrolase